MSENQNKNEDDAIMVALLTQYRHFGFLVKIEEEDENDTNKSNVNN